MSGPPKATATHAAVWQVVLIYAAFAALWILFSDRAVAWLFTDAATIVAASTLKGWFFVAVTSLLLYGLLVLFADRIRQAQDEKLRALQLLNATAENSISERKRAEAVLRDSEQRFHQIFDNMSSGTAIYAAVEDGQDFVFNDFNRAAEKIEGIARQELIGRRVTEVFPGVGEFGLLAVLQRVWRTGKAESFPITHYQDERITGWRENYVCRLSSGEVVAIYDDITERKSAEESLVQSEQRFKDIAQASVDWIWEVDRDGRYTYVSEGIQALLGYAPAEILGKTPFDLMPADEAERVRTAFLAFVARCEPFRDLDNINIHKDGSLCHVYTSGVPILDGTGQLLGYRGVDRDITEHKLDVQKLHESEEKYRQLFEGSHDALMMAAPPGWHFTAANPATLALFGAGSLAEFMALGLGQVSPERQPDGRTSAEKAPEMIRQAMRDGTHHFEWRHQRLNGACFDADVLLTRIEQGEKIAIQATVRDISARLATETELKQRNEELERFNRVTVGREMDIIEMKMRINALSAELGREPPYPLAFLNPDNVAAAP